MLIKTIDDLAVFISNWSGLSLPFPGGPTPLPQHIPEPIRKLDALLGGFWGQPPYPIEPHEHDHNTERGIFSVQNTIFNPRDFLTREEATADDPIVPFIEENQGVYGVGYTAENTVMVHGELTWNEELAAGVDSL